MWVLAWVGVCEAPSSLTLRGEGGRLAHHDAEDVSERDGRFGVEEALDERRLLLRRGRVKAVLAHEHQRVLVALRQPRRTQYLTCRVRKKISL